MVIDHYSITSTITMMMVKKWYQITYHIYIEDIQYTLQFSVEQVGSS